MSGLDIGRILAGFVIALTVSWFLSRGKRS